MENKVGRADPDPIEQLTDRVTALEKRDRGRGETIALVIGEVGGLIAITAQVRELWVKVTAKPRIDVVVGNELYLRWNAKERDLSLVRGVALQNDGQAVGSMKSVSARLESDALVHSEALPDIQARENQNVASIPVTIQAKNGKDLTLVMGSKFTSDLEPEFPKEGSYKLVLEVETPPAPLQQTTYCFRMASSLVDDLRQSGSAKISNNECGQ